jgi:hypothetical protein
MHFCCAFDGRFLGDFSLWVDGTISRRYHFLVMPLLACLRAANATSGFEVLMFSAPPGSRFPVVPLCVHWVVVHLRLQ